MASGEKQENPRTRRIGEGLLVEKRRQTIQITEFGGDIDNPTHRPSNDNDVLV